MLRTTKVIGGTTLVAAAAVGIAVPAYAASSSPSAPSTTAPSTTAPSTTGPSTKARVTHHPRARRGLDVLGLTPAVIAKAAGTDVPGLKAGRMAKKSLTQIAASHGLSRATLLSELNTTANAKVATLINTQLPTRPAMGKVKKCNAMPPKAKAGKRDARGLRGIPGIGGDVKSLARTLKVTPNVLRTDLRKGQTLQQVATAHKVSTATLLAALDKDVSTQLAKTVDRVPQAKMAPTASSGSMTS